MFGSRLAQFVCYAGALCLVSGCAGCFVSWQETYNHTGKNPFDLFALRQLLEARPEGFTLLPDSLGVLTDTAAGPANYLFVGSYAYYNERSVTQLLDFVERGNVAFLAAEDLPEDLAAPLFSDDCYYDFYDNSERFLTVRLDTVYASLNSYDSSFLLTHVYEHEATFRRTVYANGGLLCDSLLGNSVEGVFDYDYDGYVNFLRLPWGDGAFYLHTNPIFFTNYYLVDSLQFAYAEAALGVLGPGPVYWDEASRVPDPVARRRRQAGGGNRNYNGGRNLLTGNETLRYIQQEPPLALAWYVLLFAALLYVVFRGKRRQRVIPVVAPRVNQSRRFIDTLSRLVRQKGRHAALAQQEIDSLRYHLQRRYGVRWTHDGPPPVELVERTGLAPATVARAIAEIRFVLPRQKLTEGELVRFYRAVAPLYAG